MTKAFWTLLRRELGALLFSPIACVVFTLFSLVTAYWFLSAVDIMSHGIYNLTVMQLFFRMFFFWFCLVVMIPLLTMRLFAEEYKTGTIELLMTAPVTDWDVILSKFFGALLFYLLLWSHTLLYLWIYQVLTGYANPVEWGALGLSYGMVLLLGSFFTAIGIFTSSLSKNQVVAAFAAFAAISLYFFCGFLAFMRVGENLQQGIQYISALRHMEVYVSGIFDTRPLVLYSSGTVLFLFLTYVVLSVRRLRN